MSYYFLSYIQFNIKVDVAEDLIEKSWGESWGAITVIENGVFWHEIYKSKSIKKNKSYFILKSIDLIRFMIFIF